MNKFKIGDRVIHKRMGIIGTIRVIDDTSLPYGVEFDDKISGLNNLQGLCEIGYGLWVSEEEIELEKEMRMEMSEFKIGDRVKYIGTNSNYKGKVGTIVTIDDDSIPYGIEFDEKVYGGHSLDGECEYGYGKWFELEEIELINPTLEDYTTKKLKDYTTKELEEELKKRKENKINEILEILNNNIKELRELGYTIPYKDNTTIDSLELNKALDSIGVFYE